MGRRTRFRDALAVGEFRALWAAELMSIAGDQLARVALAVLVYQQTSSAGWTALTYAFTYLPAFLGGAFLSGLADRYPRRELMVVVDLCRAVIAGGMALPFLPLPVLAGLVFVLTLAGSPFKAAQQALLPTVLPGETYIAGLSLRTVTNQSAHLAGFLGGGVILTVLDPRMALGLNAGTFLVASVIVALGVRRRPAARAITDSGGTAGALRLIWRDRHLRWLVAVTWLVGLFVVPEGLAAPYAASLGAATVAVGLLMAADPVGSIVGAWLVGRIPQGSRSALITPLAVASGVPLAACVFHPGLVASMVLWAMSGALSTAYVILAQASFIRSVPDERRAAASGLASTGLLTSQGLAILSGGLLAEATGPVLAIASTGAAGAILVGLVGLWWLGVHSRRGDSRTRPGEVERGEATSDDDITSPWPSSSAPPLAGPAAELGTGGADQVIIARRLDRAVTVSDRSSRVPWRWPLWRVPLRALIFIVAVELFAVGITVSNGLHTSVQPGMLITFGVIVGLGVATGEMTRRTERVRRRFNDTPHVNFTSVWIIPAAFLLPPIFAAAVVATLYFHLYWRSWYRVRGVHAHRLTFSATSVVLATYTAGAVSHLPPLTGTSGWNQVAAAGTVALSLVGFSVVNSGLVAVAVSFHEGRIDLHRAVGTARETALEFGTLGLGAAAALLINLHPVWALTMVPALVVLHKIVLLRQLEEAAATDPKTGLTNASAWTNMAATEVERAKRNDASAGVLMVDLDHFKAINTEHGHLVGDQILQAIADTLSKAVRREDTVGRWGGEEFVVLCPDVSAEELLRIGERICELVRQLRIPVSVPGHGGIIDGLTVSIGAATYPEFGPELQDVLLAADDALFVAKDHGRDQVRSIVDGFDGFALH